MSTIPMPSRHAAGMAARLRKTAPGVWAGISLLRPSGGAPCAPAITRARDAAQSAVHLLAATRLVLNRWLDGESQHCLGLEGTAGTPPLAVPLTAPGANTVSALIADAEGWLQHGRRTAPGEPAVRVRLAAELPSADGAALALALDAPAGHVTVASAAIEAWRLQLLSEQIAHVARRIAQCPPDTLLDDLDPLPTDHRALLAQWSGVSVPAAAAGAGWSPADALARHVAAQPTAVAVVQGNHRLSYAEFDRRANGVACALRAAGVQANDRVAIVLERGIDLVVAVWGVLKAGGAYVPIDPTYPDERRGFMLQDCAPAVVVTSAAHAAQVRDADVPLLLAETVPEAAEPPPARADEDALAYVIYTSGSTGRPKGASVTRRGMANLLAWYVSQLELSHSDRVLVATSCSFDLTQKNLVAPLCVGAQVHLCAPGFDPIAVLDAAHQGGATVANLTPSYFQALAECDLQGAMATLRWVVLGGEPIQATRLAASRQRWPGMQFLNSYGPTECADVVASHVLDAADFAPGAPPPPVGRPIPGDSLVVLDPSGRLAMPGAIGEICVGGVGVGNGYLNQPELTASRFIQDPWQAGCRLYRTGDLGRWRADGRLEYLGRDDAQVKVRGHRVELGEIEHALQACAGVREAVVRAISDSHGVARLVGYVTGNRLSPESLRETLSARLPDFMLPAQFLVLDEMPLTPSGKIDRQALPAPEAAPHRSQPPQTPGEALVWEVWCELFGRTDIGTNDDFFRIGGHSLLATRLLAGLTRRSGKALGISDLFDHTTVRAQAELLERAHSATPSVPILAAPGRLQAAEREEVLL